MNKRCYLLLSALIFGIVALLHIGRAAAGVAVRVAESEFPMWLSWVGGVVALALCVWGFRLSRE